MSRRRKRRERREQKRAKKKEELKQKDFKNEKELQTFFENNREEEYRQIRESCLSVSDLMFYIIRRMVSENRDVLDNSYILDNGITYYVKIERENNEDNK